MKKKKKIEHAIIKSRNDYPEDILRYYRISGMRTNCYFFFHAISYCNSCL